MASLANSLFRIRRTVYQMLADRGYAISQTELEMSFDDFRDKFSDTPARDQLTILVSTDSGEQLFVFFPEEAKVGVKTIRKYCDRMKAENVQRAIIVVQNNPTAFARQALESVGPHFHLEHFLETELLVNITHHERVPTHIPLTPQQKQALLERYKLKETQLPRMQITSPISRYFGLSRGQVVKIIRPSETAGRYVTYRLVV
eukprot:gnl/Trimastix_PCT/545.p1 GENE.gnl/Trimastix_PCT/545~~gnl/Trimastix_PCT/545.p1  ORF type:complete len:202 (+),score=43.65 gnl/Trimastix_PCT/545:64-669(+)